MRSDRGTALVTILVMLCCLGGTVTAGSIVSQRVLVASVASSHSSGVVKVGSRAYALVTQSQGLMTYNDLAIDSQDEIVDYHNLPPPWRRFVL